MKDFEIFWVDTVKEYYSGIVSAENEEEAIKIWKENPYLTDFNGYNVESISIDFDKIEEL